MSYYSKWRFRNKPIYLRMPRWQLKALLWNSVTEQQCTCICLLSANSWNQPVPSYMALVALLQLWSQSKSRWESVLFHCNVNKAQFVRNEAKPVTPFPAALGRTSSSQEGCSYKGHHRWGPGPFHLCSPASTLQSTGSGPDLPTGFALAKFSLASARTSETALL